VNTDPHPLSELIGGTTIPNHSQSANELEDDDSLHDNDLPTPTCAEPRDTD
jgi:hypothetical protein